MPSSNVGPFSARFATGGARIAGSISVAILALLAIEPVSLHALDAVFIDRFPAANAVPINASMNAVIKVSFIRASPYLHRQQFLVEAVLCQRSTRRKQSALRAKARLPPQSVQSVHLSTTRLHCHGDADPDGVPGTAER